jgi:predicted transposase YdaD
VDIPLLAHPHDRLAKHFLANVDLAADFLRNYVDREVVDKLDLDWLQCESPVKVDSELVEGIGDLRFSAGFKGSGRGLEVFIFLEHQSSPDPFIGFRMLKYIVSSYQEFAQGKGKAAGGGGIFPYPLAVVLYHGESPWSGPLKMRELIKRHAGLPGEVLDFPVFLVDLAKIPPGEIRGVPAMRALLTALRAASKRELGKSMGVVLQAAAEEREEFRRKDWLRALLRYYLVLEKPHEGLKAIAGTLGGIMDRKEAEEMTASLAEELILQGRVEGRAEGRVEGRAKGRVEGRVEGEAKGIILVLKTRFNSVPERIEKRVRACSSPEQLETWIRLAASCQSLEEFGRNIE